VWDLKLKVGHFNAHHPRFALTLGREDVTIQTAFVEHRFYRCRIPRWHRILNETLKTDLFAEQRTAALSRPSWKSRDAAPASRVCGYVVDPNVKRAKGGLRDLESLLLDRETHL